MGGPIMGKVVARMYVSNVSKKPDGTAEIELQAVVSKENAHWSEYTPSGSLRLSLTRKASGALAVFEGAVDRARARNEEENQGEQPKYYRPECLVTLDFDAPDHEEPRYVQGEGYKPD